MSFCCPAGMGCNDQCGDGRNGYLSAKPECYRVAVLRCVDGDLAELADDWAVRRTHTSWWRPLRRRRLTRRYRGAVALAFAAGIEPRMIRPPCPPGLPRASRFTNDSLSLLDAVEQRLAATDLPEDVRETLERRRAALLRQLDPTPQPEARPVAHPLPNPPAPPWSAR